MKALLSIMSLLLSGASFATGSEPTEADYAGLRFRCHSLGGPEICLRVLRPECTLRVSKVRGEDNEVIIPSVEVLLLACPGISKEVFSPADLAGHVTIEQRSDALEYLRFFSSLWTVAFFEKEQMEIFLADDEECYASCLPAARWAALNLRPIAVEEEKGTFRVTRNVVRPEPNALEVTAYRVLEEVLSDGTVRPGSEEESLPLTPEDQARLTFRRAK